MLFLEALMAAVFGLLVLWLVLRPLLYPTDADQRASAAVFEPLDPEETPKGIALAALKEIEFDRETGKLSDVDYQALKSKYTTAAIEALRVEERREPARHADSGVELASGVTCPTCGPRPEPDARFCSTCGCPLPPRGAAHQTTDVPAREAQSA